MQPLQGAAVRGSHWWLEHSGDRGDAELAPSTGTSMPSSFCLSVPSFLCPSTPSSLPGRATGTRLGWACPSVVTCWRNTSFLRPNRPFSHCCTLFSNGDRTEKGNKNGLQILLWSKFKANPREFIMKVGSSWPQDAGGAEKWWVFRAMCMPREPPILQNTQKPPQIRKSLNTKWLDARRIIYWNMFTLLLYLVSPWALSETGHEPTQPILPVHVLSSQDLFHTPWKQYLPFSKQTTLPSNRKILVFKYDQYHPSPWPLISVLCQALKHCYPNWARTSSTISITHSLQGLWHQLCLIPIMFYSFCLSPPHQEPQIPKIRFGRWKEGVKAGRKDLGKEG